jgi:hypothetical protein
MLYVSKVCRFDGLVAKRQALVLICMLPQEILR